MIAGFRCSNTLGITHAMHCRFTAAWKHLLVSLRYGWSAKVKPDALALSPRPQGQREAPVSRLEMESLARVGW